MAVKELDILYEDDLCLILNKPAGLAVQGGKGVGVSLDKILAARYSPAPLLTHRLDKDTSGVILTAKTKDAAALFSRLFACGKIKKLYTAVCLGRMNEKNGVIKDDLIVGGSAKKSKTSYTVVKTALSPYCEDDGGEIEFSILEIAPETGRMHQIRRHLAMAGNPVLGDDKYGNFAANKTLRKTAGVKRLLLHANALSVSGEVNFKAEAPLPPCFDL